MDTTMSEFSITKQERNLIKRLRLLRTGYHVMVMHIKDNDSLEVVLLNKSPLQVEYMDGCGGA